MIESADEFLRLRTSEDISEQARAAAEEASEETWLDVIARFPDMHEWVPINKTIPLSILRILADHPDWRVRTAVAAKRKLSEDLFELLSEDSSEIIRQTIAYNKKTPVRILQKLLSDPEEMVREAASRRMDNL